MMEYVKLKNMMKPITNINIYVINQLYAKISRFYFNAKLEKYKYSYGWDEVLKDIQLSLHDMSLMPTNKTTNEWLNNGYNVARNKRGWAFAYIIKDDTMFIYDAENCRNLTVDYQNTSPFIISTANKQLQNKENIAMGYKISACRLDDGYIYLFKNGKRIPNYRFNEIINIFRKHKGGEVYAIGLYGNKKFKITLDGIARALIESQISKIVDGLVKNILSEATINGHTIPLEKRINNWRCVDGFYMEYFITLHGKETDDSQDVRWYEDTDKKVPTICLFRRTSNGKYFYARVFDDDDKSQTTSIQPISRSEVPAEILNDIHTLPLPPESVIASPSWRRKGKGVLCQ